MDKSMTDVLKELRRPFHSSNTVFKVAANTQGKSALCVAYIDARHVQERLNVVCEGQWSNTFREIYEDDYIQQKTLNDSAIIGKKLKAVEATIKISGWEGENPWTISHADIGAADNVNEDFSFGYKALYSDAFKRAAVHFGIAAPFYAMPKLWLEKNDTNFKMKGDKPSYMKDAGEDVLRRQYKQYLANEGGVEKFGEPL